MLHNLFKTKETKPYLLFYFGEIPNDFTSILYKIMGDASKGINFIPITFNVMVLRFYTTKKKRTINKELSKFLYNNEYCSFFSFFLTEGDNPDNLKVYDKNVQLVLMEKNFMTNLAELDETIKGFNKTRAEIERMQKEGDIPFTEVEQDSSGFSQVSQEDIDRILDKINKQGKEALTEQELEILKNHS